MTFSRPVAMEKPVDSMTPEPDTVRSQRVGIVLSQSVQQPTNISVLVVGTPSLIVPRRKSLPPATRMRESAPASSHGEMRPPSFQTSNVPPWTSTKVFVRILIQFPSASFCGTADLLRPMPSAFFATSLPP